MTVAELIDLLRKEDPKMEVFANVDAFGPIRCVKVDELYITKVNGEKSNQRKAVVLWEFSPK